MKLLQILLRRIQVLFTWFWKLSLWKKIALTAICIAIVWFVFPRITGQKNNTPLYQTARVEKGTLVSSVSASGTLSSGNNVAITTSATGIISTVYVKKGDMVTAGQKIADITLDRNSMQQQTAAWANYLAAQNTLNSAKSQMNALQAALFQANQTFVNGAGTEDPITDDPTYIIERANWLQAEANYTQQANVIKQAEAALANSSLLYQQTSSVITAPTAGTVSGLTIVPGFPLTATSQSQSSSDSNAADSSQSLGTVTLTGGKPQAIVNLSEIDVTKIREQQKVTLTLDAFPNKTFTGDVVAIDTSGAVSSGVTAYPATISIDSLPSNAYPNMAVSAKIITLIKDNVLLVPTAAVQSTGGETSVRVMKNGQVQQVPVVVGESSDTETEIVEGLSVGEEIVTSVVTQGVGSQSTASPFGGQGGFGGIRGGGGGNRVFIQGR